ncbi:hypothetical protein [Psychromonas sp. psych-6C06]|uniref:hypothetical protein n=1 Tax=Psychromonas sp. psych-6C06 TaxID=2058089 RepID=UPI00187C992D|nr:hypothetical protein [Psychromonas sp. psych-6C06]
MASNIQKPNLKIKDKVLNKIKLSTIISAITLKLMTEIPNINRTNADNKSAANSNITLLKKKNAKAENCTLHCYKVNWTERVKAG